MADPTELFLCPGDLRFSAAGTRMKTLLGSCVAITIWHPVLRIGGMCHYLVPTRPLGRQGQVGPPLNGRYGDEAVGLFLREIRRVGTRPQEYQVKMFGGGDQFPGQAIRVSRHNVTTGLALLRANGFGLDARHVGGTGARKIVFDLTSGDVWLQHRAVRVGP